MYDEYIFVTESLLPTKDYSSLHGTSKFIFKIYMLPVRIFFREILTL